MSGRLFAEPIPRRSTRLSGDSNAGTGQQSSTMGGGLSGVLSGNGMGHPSGSTAGAAGSMSRGGNAATLRSSTSRRSIIGLPETSVDNGNAAACVSSKLNMRFLFFLLSRRWSVKNRGGFFAEYPLRQLKGKQNFNFISFCTLDADCLVLSRFNL